MADGFEPTAAMKAEAERGLAWRAEHNRGGTEIGVARARDISNGRTLSLDTVKRMASYFARHEIDKQGQGWSPGEDGYPSAGRIAWSLWGGDPGRAWADKILKAEGDKAMDELSFKSLALEIKRAPDDAGSFEGYASVFGEVDLGLDSVQPGAFADSLRSGRKVKLLWQHDMGDPIGVWDEIREDGTGLYVKGRLLADVQKGREAMALLRAGAIDSMSIGYRTIEEEYADGGRVRLLKKIDLFEISLVTFPMLPAAKVTGVKSITTEREYERFLRDAGFSRSEAVALTSHGFKGLSGRRDADSAEADTGGNDALINAIRQLTEKLHV